ALGVELLQGDAVLAVLVVVLDHRQLGTLLDIHAKVGSRAGQGAEVGDLVAAVLAARTGRAPTRALVTRRRPGDERHNGQTAERPYESMPQGFEPSSISVTPSSPWNIGSCRYEGDAKPDRYADLGRDVIPLPRSP